MLGEPTQIYIRVFGTLRLINPRTPHKFAMVWWINAISTAKLARRTSLKKQKIRNARDKNIKKIYTCMICVSLYETRERTKKGECVSKTIKSKRLPLLACHFHNHINKTLWFPTIINFPRIRFIVDYGFVVAHCWQVLHVFSLWLIRREKENQRITRIL